MLSGPVDLGCAAPGLSTTVYVIEGVERRRRFGVHGPRGWVERYATLGVVRSQLFRAHGRGTAHKGMHFRVLTAPTFLGRAAAGLRTRVCHLVL